MATTSPTGATDDSETNGRGRREQRRQRHHELSRGQFLDAAEEVFGRKGFHDTTLKEVAELAEFSVGSVYSFFDSKDDLFRQVFVRRGAEFMPALHEVLDDAAGDPLAQLHALVDFQVEFFRARPHFGRVFLRHSSALRIFAERDIDELVLERFEESMRLQVALFERGQQAGVFRQGDPDVLSRLLLGIMSSYQSVDPAIVDDDPVTERLPLADLHAIVESAFVAP